MARISGFAVATIACAVLAVGGFTLMAIGGAKTVGCDGFRSLCTLAAAPYTIPGMLLAGTGLLSSIFVGIAWALSPPSDAGAAGESPAPAPLK